MMRIFSGLIAYALVIGCVEYSLADTIFMQEKKNGNTGTVLEESAQYIIIKFPREEIRLIRRDEISQPSGIIDEEMKQSLKEELKEELIKEIKEELKKGDSGQALVSGKLNTEIVKIGNVDGRILRGGKGLEGCNVKIIKQIEGQSFIGMLKEAEAGAEFETVTDDKGQYVFKDIPVGKYVMKWLTPGADAWVRKLSDKPDVIVEDGKTVNPPDIETTKPIMGR